MKNGRRQFRKDVTKLCALLKDAKTVAMKRHYHGQVTNVINQSKESILTNDCHHTYYLWGDKGYGKTKDWEAFLSGTEALKIYLEFKAVMELADNTNINLSMSRQCYHKRRKTDKTRLANFLSDHELLVDSTHPEAYLNILKQKRDEINEKWLDNYYTDPTTKVFAGGNEKTPEHHWRCEMAKLNQMIVESERTLAETEDVPELIPEQAVELAAQEEQPRQPTASASDDANAQLLAKMSADIEALKIQIAAVNTPAATGSAAVAAAASNSGNIDNTDDDDDFYDEF